MKEEFVNALRNIAEIAQKATEDNELTEEKRFFVTSELSKCIETLQKAETKVATIEEIKELANQMR